MEFPTIDKFAKEIAEKALDEITYEGKTVREWMEIIVKQQLSEDCISREEVRRILGNEVFELTKLHTVNPEDNPKADAMAYGVNWSLNTLMELPSVTPQQRIGHWEYVQYDNNPNIGNWHCSECRGICTEMHSIKDAYNYCPNCGADMRGENNGNMD